jgi:hypothetical protein
VTAVDALAARKSRPIRSGARHRPLPGRVACSGRRRRRNAAAEAPGTRSWATPTATLNTHLRLLRTFYQLVLSVRRTAPVQVRLQVRWDIALGPARRNVAGQRAPRTWLFGSRGAIQQHWARRPRRVIRDFDVRVQSVRAENKSIQLLGGRYPQQLPRR